MDKNRIHENYMMNNLMSLRLALMALLLMATISFSATNINSCINITTPGEYQLNTDILWSGSPGNICIEIQTDDVTLFGNGYTLQNQGSGGVGIATKGVAKNNITIKGMDLFGDFDAAIYATTNNTVIENNTIGGFEVSSVGIFIDGFYSGTYNSYNLTIYNNTIYNFQGTSAGIVVNEFVNVNISNNTLYNFGINITSPSLDGYSYGVLTDSKQLNGSNVLGTTVTGGSVQNVTFDGNTIYNFYDYARGATISSIGGYLSVRYNNISSFRNGSWGMIIKDTDPANQGIIANNTIYNATESYLFNSGGNNILIENNTLHSFNGTASINYYGMSFSGTTNSIIRNNQIYNFTKINGMYFLGDNNNITNNKIYNYSVLGTAFSGVQFHLENSYVIFENNEMYNYVGSSTRAGVVATGDHLTLKNNFLHDMNGGGIYVLANSGSLDDILVESNTIVNFTLGFGVFLSALTTSTNITAYKNTVANFSEYSGVYVGAGKVNVTENFIKNYTSSSFAGIYITGDVPGSVIYNNTVADFSARGIQVDITNKPISISNNLIENFTNGYGIYGTLTGANVTYNTIRNFTGTGIWTDAGSVNFDQNTIETSTDGTTTVYGFFISGATSQFNITNNTLTIQNTTTSVTNSYGIYLTSTTSGNVDRNIVNFAYYGIYLASSSSNTISNNLLCGVLDTAIYLSVGSNNNNGLNNHGVLLRDFGTGNNVQIINDCGSSPIITSCIVINNAANTKYTLGANLVGSPNVRPYTDACIAVENSQNIEIDCNGFSISELSPTTMTSAIGIYNVSNINITGCNLNDYGRPIVATGTSLLEQNYIYVYNTTINYTYSGIQLEYSYLNMENVTMDRVRHAIMGGPQNIHIGINNSYFKFRDDPGITNIYFYISNSPSSSSFFENHYIKNTIIDASEISTYEDVAIVGSGLLNSFDIENVSFIGKLSTAMYFSSSSPVTINNISINSANNSLVFDNTNFFLDNAFVTTYKTGLFAQGAVSANLENVSFVSLSSIAPVYYQDLLSFPGTIQLGYFKNVSFYDVRGAGVVSVNPSVYPAIPSTTSSPIAFIGPALFGETLPPAPSGYSELNGRVIALLTGMNVTNVEMHYFDSDVPSGINESLLVAMWYDGSTWQEIPQVLDQAKNTITFNHTTSRYNFLITDPDNGNTFNVALYGIFYKEEIIPNYNQTGDVIFHVIFTGKSYASGYDVILQKRDEYGNYYVVGNGTTGLDGIVAINLSYNETVPQVFRVSIVDPSGTTVLYEDRFVTEFNTIVLTPSFSFIDMMKQALLIGQNLLLLVLGIILISMHQFGWTKGLAVGSFFSTMFLAGISYALEIPLERIWLVWLVALTSMAVGAAIFLRRFDV